MLSEELKYTIKLFRNKYCRNVCEIPELEDIKELHNENTMAQVITGDLHDKKYILYIHSDLAYSNANYMEQILFHEFTHISDSIQFLNYNIVKFKDIMQIYSEIHASEIQMNVMLSYSKSNVYNLNQDVIFNKGMLKLQSFMKQSLDHAMREFSSYGSNDILNTYYFIGYLNSLKKHGIEFKYKYKNIRPELIESFQLITNSILNNTYTYNELLKTHRYLLTLVQKPIPVNVDSIINKLIDW